MQLYIRTEEKHAQRMAVRAKYMTTDPARNKYVRNMRNIRTIQDYLARAADKLAVPKLSNSNLDISVEAVHRSVMRVVHRCALVAIAPPVATAGAALALLPAT